MGLAAKAALRVFNVEAEFIFLLNFELFLLPSSEIQTPAVSIIVLIIENNFESFVIIFGV